MRHFGADVLITLMDVWVTRAFSLLAPLHGWRWLPWLPVDHEPVPPVVLEHLKGCYAAVPYSRFGERELQAAGLRNVRYVPHGVSENFRPGEQAAARAKLGIPQERFVIGMVAANMQQPARKCFAEQMAAFAEFHKRHPEALLYLHTHVGREMGGVDILAIARQLGIMDCLMYSDPYAYQIGFPEPLVATLYQAFDVLSGAAMNEGFGIPLLEAQACGTPVVSTAWTSMPELTWAGIAVDQGQRFWTALNSWAFIPKIEALTDAYEALYERLHDPAQAAQLHEGAVEGARPYAWERVVNEWWAPVLATL
jgi:glycosyltransferase involved in cell wall biosynthesis